MGQFDFHLEVTKDKVVLSLRKGDEVIEELLVGDGYSLMENLLPSIDALLQKRQLQAGDVKDFTVASELPEGYSARRITETVASIYRFGLEK